jgi:hypothetical protein
VGGGRLPRQRAGLRRRHATASWAYLFRLIKLLSSSSSSSSSSSLVNLILQTGVRIPTEAYAASLKNARAIRALAVDVNFRRQPCGSREGGKGARERGSEEGDGGDGERKRARQGRGRGRCTQSCQPEENHSHKLMNRACSVAAVSSVCVCVCARARFKLIMPLEHARALPRPPLFLSHQNRSERQSRPCL